MQRNYPMMSRVIRCIFIIPLQPVMPLGHHNIRVLLQSISTCFYHSFTNMSFRVHRLCCHHNVPLLYVVVKQLIKQTVNYQHRVIIYSGMHRFAGCRSYRYYLSVENIECCYCWNYYQIFKYPFSSAPHIAIIVYCFDYINKKFVIIMNYNKQNRFNIRYLLFIKYLHNFYFGSFRPNPQNQMRQNSMIISPQNVPYQKNNVSSSIPSRSLDNKNRSRKVNLAVGGLKAAQRQDQIPQHGQSIGKNYSSNYPTYYRQNNSNSPNAGFYRETRQYQNEEYKTNRATPYTNSYNNTNQYGFNKTGASMSIPVLAGGYAGSQTGGSYSQSNNNYYNGYPAGQYQRQDNYQNQGNMMVQARDDTHYDDGYGDNSHVKSKKNKKSCKEKCCGPLLWIILGLLALAALVIGLLFILGVLGKSSIPSTESMAIVNGVGYPKDSISVRSQVIRKNASPQADTEYMFAPNTSVDPIVVRPVPYSSGYSVTPNPIRAASKIISSDPSYANVQPLSVIPDRSLNIDNTPDASISPTVWIPDRYNSGYYVPTTQAQSS